MRGFPTFTMPEGDAISFELRLPTGALGARHYGERVLVRIDREVGIEVVNPVFGRVVVRGGFNLGYVTWFDLPEVEADWELCRTALEMVEAQVQATAKLFRRGYLDLRWLTERARWEVQS